MTDTSGPEQMSTPKWTAEPWEFAPKMGRNAICAKRPDGKLYRIAECVGVSTTTREDESNAARIVACVNALAGVADPEAWVAERRTARPPQPDLSKVREALEEAYADAVFARDASIIPNQQKRHAARADRAREALSILAAHGEGE